MVKQSATALIILSSLILAAIVTAAPQVVLHNVDFYLSKVPMGGKEVHFKRGETVFVVARPPIFGATVDVEVLLFFPPETGRAPLTLLSRSRITLSSDRVIVSYNIAQTEIAGKYAVRVRAWDPATGRLEEGDLPFEVVEESQITWIIIPVVILLAVAGAFMFLRGRSPAPQPSPVGAERAAVVEGPTVFAGAPAATVSVPAPSGETMRLIAWLEFGDRTIPITEVPKRFGREDFTGIVPSSVLPLISRRMPRGQFTIDYDYASSSFVISDEGSTNGTFVNGVDIRGKGRVPLKDGDIISPANAFHLRFTVKAA